MNLLKDNRGFGLIPELILAALLVVALGFAAYLDFHKSPPQAPPKALGNDCTPQTIAGLILLDLPPDTSSTTIQTLIEPIHGTLASPPGNDPFSDTLVDIKVPNSALNADIKYLKNQPTVQNAQQEQTICPA